MSDHGRRYLDGTVGMIIKALPVLILIGTFLVAWGNIKARVDYHEEMLQEMRQDIKEILHQLKEG